MSSGPSRAQEQQRGPQHEAGNPEVAKAKKQRPAWIRNISQAARNILPDRWGNKARQAQREGESGIEAFIGEQDNHVKITERPLRNLDGERIGKRTELRLRRVKGVEDAIKKTKPTPDIQQQYNQSLNDYNAIMNPEKAEDFANWMFRRLRGGNFNETPHKLDDSKTIHIPYIGFVTMGDLRFVEVYSSLKRRQPVIAVDWAEQSFNGDSYFHDAVENVPDQELTVKPRHTNRAFAILNAQSFSITYPDGHKGNGIMISRAKGELAPKFLLLAQLLARDGTLVVDADGKPIPLFPQKKEN